jgi:hypothetical protein
MISTVISANSNKSVFGYLGMVKNRLTLINNYVRLHCLLGTSKTLNTNDSQIKCNKVKDITMNYQQDTKNSCLEG